MKYYRCIPNVTNNIICKLLLGIILKVYFGGFLYIIYLKMIKKIYH